MLISGKELAKSIEEENFKVTSTLTKKPNLKIVRVGDDTASLIYTNNKLKAAVRNGVEASVISMPEDVTQEVFDSTVYNQITSTDVDGVIVQLPVPKNISLDFINRIFNKFPEKDVDGFSIINTGKLNLEKNDKNIIPCTPSGIIKMLKSLNIDYTGKVAMVIGRSNIVGKPVARLLEQMNMTVIQAHSKTEFTKELRDLVDVLIVAIGKPESIHTKDYPNCKVFIDVGINRDSNNKLCGDIMDDLDIKSNESKYITPVPGGVGPMTVVELMSNTIKVLMSNTINVTKKYLH